MLLKEEFIRSLEGCQGFLRDEMIAAHEMNTPVSVRLNVQKKNLPLDVFPAENLGDTISWCSNAYYLNRRPTFTLDPLFHAGTYYVQEASSMFIHHAVSSVFQGVDGLVALDLCAAPGGKTTLLSSMPQFRMVLANEIIQSRAPVLQENVVKWGAHHVFVSSNDPMDFEKLGGIFDLVLVDAPCSGSGLFRKDKAAMEAWNPGLVDFCAARQKRILSSAMHSVNEGGYLLYTTCSYSKEENEENLDHILKSGMFESVPIAVPDHWNVVHSISTEGKADGYRFYPDKIRGEGFFCAMLKKTGVAFAQHNPVVNKLDLVKAPSVLKDWIISPADLTFFKKENELFAVDKCNLSSLLQFREVLRMKKSGLRLGAEIRTDLIPDHELAMSFVLSGSIPSITLNVHDAIAFLRKENIESGVLGNGWRLVTYCAVGLGWAKIVNGRVKNHYPMSWRILMRN